MFNDIRYVEIFEIVKNDYENLLKNQKNKALQKCMEINKYNKFIVYFEELDLNNEECWDIIIKNYRRVDGQYCAKGYFYNNIGIGNYVKTHYKKLITTISYLEEK